MVNSGLLVRGEEFVLRAMVECDLAQVVELESSWAPVPWRHASFLHELHVPSSRASILCRKGAPDRVAGYLVRRLVAGEVHVLSLAVQREERGFGLGGALLDLVFEEARQQDVGFITLEVDTANAIARSLYGSRGFIESRRRKNYYGARRDAIVLDWRADAAACQVAHA